MKTSSIGDAVALIEFADILERGNEEPSYLTFSCHIFVTYLLLFILFSG